MTKTPEIVICGKAGSGKDSFASALNKYVKVAWIAHADPMKRLVYQAYGFTIQQLWGPSEARNANDTRVEVGRGATFDHLMRQAEGWLGSSSGGGRWVDEVATAAGLNCKNMMWDRLLDWHNEHVATQYMREDRFTARHVLQTLGTEWGRSVNTGLWAAYAESMLGSIMCGHVNYTATSGLKEDLGVPTPDFGGITDGRFANEILRVKRRGGWVVEVYSPAPVEAQSFQNHASEQGLKSIPPHWYDAVVENNKSKGLGSLDFLARAVAEEMLKGTNRYYDLRSTPKLELALP